VRLFIARTSFYTRAAHRRAVGQPGQPARLTSGSRLFYVQNSLGPLRGQTVRKGKAAAVGHIDTFLESSLDTVDLAEEAVLKVAKEAGLQEEGRYELGMAVREIMTNAVVHGNRYSLNKKVHLVVSREENAVIVKIGDEGDGYTPDCQPDPLAEENLLNQSGRGMMIVRAFVDEVLVTSEPRRGTEVTMRKYLQSEA